MTIQFKPQIGIWKRKELNLKCWVLRFLTPIAGLLDAQDVISNCDYSFLGDGILDTEIVEVYDQNDYKVF